MDPLSTIANVITLFEFSVKLQDLVSRWKDAPEYVRHLEQSVSDMRTVLRLITDKSEVASAASEDRLYMDTIGAFAETCSRLVRELYEILLPLDKSASSRDRLRQRLVGLLKERDINDKRRQIQEYTSKLILVLASLNSKKSSRIETVLQEFTRKLDDFLTLPSYTSLPEANATIQEEPSPTDGFEFLLNDAAPAEPGERRPSVLDGIQSVKLRNMKQKVQDLHSKKMFRKAAQIQQNIIEMVKSEVDGQGEDDVCDLQEQHADLLLECSTPACLHEATIILSDALQRQKERTQTATSLEQQGRLMSKLAKLYRDGDGLGEAHDSRKSKSFFTNSIIYLSRSRTFLTKDFLTVGAAMVQFHEANSELDLAIEIKRRILNTLKQRSPEFHYDWNDYTSLQEQNILEWCRQHGFSAKQLQFRFDVIQASKEGDTSPLHLAIQEGEKDIVEKMLVEVDAVDLPDHNGMTPLLLAAQKRQSEIAQVLLDYGASAEVRTPDQRTSLHLCLEDDPRGGVRATKCLLDGSPKLINQLDGKGKTALHWAVLKSHQRIATLLLERKANLNIQEENGKTPLLMAVESRAPKPVRAQTNLGRVSTVSTSGTIPSMNSSTSSGSRRSSQTSYSNATGSTSKSTSRVAIIALLLDNGADPTIADYTDNLPLHSACKQNDIETVKLLLQKWAQHGRDLVNQPGPMRATPIIAAVRGQHVAIVRELIRWGANPSLKDSTGKSAGDYARHPATRKHDLTRALQGA